MSDRYALIGNPVAHSKSPASTPSSRAPPGRTSSTALIEAPLDGFAQAVERFRAAGGKGLNVTLPFKEQAFALCARRQRARPACRGW